MTKTSQYSRLSYRIAETVAVACYELRRAAVERIYHRALRPLRFRFAAWRLRKRMRHAALHPSPRRVSTNASSLTVILRLGHDRDRTIFCLDRLFALSERKVDLMILCEANAPDVSHAIASWPAEWRPCVTAIESYADALSKCGSDCVLLINDSVAIATDNLEQAYEQLDGANGAGAIVPRVHLPHGALFSAGGILIGGRAIRYESCSGGATPSVMFRRDVDYGGTELLLLSNQAFAAIAQELDSSTAAGETAGIELCRRLHEQGYRVSYEPSFTATFLGEQLPAERPKTSDIPARAILEARDRRAVRGRILLIEDRVPHDWLGAGFPRSRAMVDALLELGYFVTFYPTFDVPEWWGDVHKTLDPRVEVMLGAGLRGLRRFLRARAGYYDACIVTRPHNMRAVQQLLAQVRAEGDRMRLIYDAEALFSLRDVAERRIRGEVVPHDEEVEAVAEEVALTKGCDAVLAVSQNEAEHFEQQEFTSGARPVYVLSYPAEPNLTPAPFEERSGFLFVGALHHRHSPNADSLRWFVEDVLPLLRNELNGSVKLRVVGINITDWSLDGIEDVEYLGRRDDLPDLYNSARVFVAPTRYAAGVPLKVYGAAAAGVPVVATSLLGTQLGWSGGRELCVADTANEFARVCAELHSDKGLWSRIRERAFKQVCSECSRERFRETLEAALATQSPANRSTLRADMCHAAHARSCLAAAGHNT